jgi:hypothetical protein
MDIELYEPEIKICLNGKQIGTFREESDQDVLEGIAGDIIMRFAFKKGEYTFDDKYSFFKSEKERLRRYRIADILRVAQTALEFVNWDINADILTGAHKAIKVDLSNKGCKFNAQAYQCALRLIAFKLSNLMERDVALVRRHFDGIKDFAEVTLRLQKEKPAQKEESAQA